MSALLDRQQAKIVFSYISAYFEMIPAHLFNKGIGASEIARRLKIGRASVYWVLTNAT